MIRLRSQRGQARYRAASLALLFALWAGLCRPACAATPPPGHHTAPADLAAITIQGLRQRHTLAAAVDRFVFSTLVSLGHDRYPRWDRAICPLVAGLTREQGEFILERITQVARAAHAPLAGPHCRANLFVMVTSRPHLLLKKWWAKDRRMYDTRDGIAPVRRFIASNRPVHVWYNTSLGCSGLPLSAADPENALASAGMLIAGAGGVVCNHGVDTLLTTAAVRGFSSVIVVVDSKQMHGITFGQLAAYVAMVGLAEVNQSAAVGPMPTILQLFQGVSHPPQDLTDWDSALLYGVYSTHQASTLQVSEINGAMLKKIER